MLMGNIRFSSCGKSGKHSSGALYVTICNTPREKRFRREETILAAVIPGPHEPSLEQLNNVIRPFVDDVLQLHQGEYFNVIYVSLMLLE